jgi:hypothetical protein
MNQPSVFISCVSPEFRQTRSRVAAILTRLGYTPVIQEIFGTEPGDLRQVPKSQAKIVSSLAPVSRETSCGTSRLESRAAIHQEKNCGQ